MRSWRWNRPTSLEPGPISEEKNKVFPLHDADRSEGCRARPIQRLPLGARRPIPKSDTETFIALKCTIDNWRWAGVPFFLRTGKRLELGQRIISIAFREPPKSMFPAGLRRRLRRTRSSHLRLGRRIEDVTLIFTVSVPDRAMKLEKLSLQFAMKETGLIDDVLEAYERLILDAMRGDHTLFTTAEGIERLWGSLAAVARSAAAGAAVPAGIVGTEIDPPARRAACVAAPIRGGAWRDPNVTGA